MSYSKKIIFTKINILTVILCILSLFILNGCKKENVKESYMIDVSNNYIAYQGNMQCSGYAFSYALRQVGLDIDGETLYNSFTPKEDDGSVEPTVIIENLKNRGYKATMYTDKTINKIKQEICNDNVVVTMVRITSKSNDLHYLPIIGYDDKYVYAAESVFSLCDTKGESFSRCIIWEEFIEMLDLKIHGKNNYIIVKKS